jgi:hypothetical protein
MEGLFEHWLRIIDLKLGFEVRDVVGDAGAVGATTGICEREALVGHIITEATPIALAATVLLDLLGVGIGIAMLAKEAWDMLNGEGGSLSNALVVTVVGLVRAGHVDKLLDRGESQNYRGALVLEVG